jgi:integrase
VVGWITDNRPASTVKAYTGYARRYMEFTVDKGLAPEVQSSLCAFMKHGLEKGLGRSTLVNTIPSAVADIFRFEPGGPNRAPEGNALLRQTRETIRRLTAPSKSKSPVERGQLLLMVELGTQKTLDVRDMCMLVFMFIGWFRESETTALQESDVQLERLEGVSHGESLVLTIRKSKTDKFHEGATVVLAGCPGHGLCPVAWYKKYMACRANGPTFFTQEGKEGKGGPLGPTKPNFVIKDWLQRIGVDPKGYGSHSLRRGGTTAAMQAKVRTHLIKRHGRWSSDAVYLYMVDDIHAKLEVSRKVVGVGL